MSSRFRLGPGRIPAPRAVVREGGEGSRVDAAPADTGVLVVHAPAVLAGREIEIRRDDGLVRRAVVSARTLPGQGVVLRRGTDPVAVVHAAVFRDVPEGWWAVAGQDGVPPFTIDLEPGAVREVRWAG